MEESKVVISRSLATLLLDMAANDDPQQVNVQLITTSGAEYDEVPDEREVFTDFYFPKVSSPLKKVFGVNLGIPNGQTSARFISHPEGDIGVRLTDDLHEVIFVGTPPWDVEENINAYSIGGSELTVEIVDVEVDSTLDGAVSDLQR